MAMQFNLRELKSLSILIKLAAVRASECAVYIGAIVAAMIGDLAR